MSFWAATVITNLFSAIPLVGPSIVEWLWGGFSIGSPTLNRFFSLHFLLPFLIAAMACIHLAFLHKNGSNNPLTVDSSADSIQFYPYFFVKDVLGLQWFLILFSAFVFFSPNTLGQLWPFQVIKLVMYNTICWKFALFFIVYYIIRLFINNTKKQIAIIIKNIILFFIKLQLIYTNKLNLFCFF